MDTPDKSSFESLIDSTQAYAKTTLELSKLKGLNSTANVVGMLIARLCLLVTIILFLVIVSIGAALWLSDELGKPYYGFFIVSAFYFVVFGIFYFFLTSWITNKFSDLVISKALD